MLLGPSSRSTPVPRNSNKIPRSQGLSGGGFIVTWQSKDQDGDNWGVYGQRFDSAGNPTGSEFRINTVTALEQQKPCNSRAE